MRSLSDTELQEVLERAVGGFADAGFVNLYAVATALRVDLTDDDARWPLIWALEYREVSKEDSDERPYRRFVPRLHWVGGVFPPPVPEVDDEALQVWARAADLSPRALLRARFCDLLWEGRFGEQPVQWAHAAIEGYVDAATAGWGAETDLADGLVRALELTAQLQDKARDGAVTAALVSMADAYLRVDERAPGIVIPILNALAARPLNRRPAELIGLIERATQVYADDPWSLQSTLDIHARLLPDEDRPALYAQQAEGFLAFARKATGLGRFLFLQRAREIASSQGLPALADSIRQEIESMGLEDLELKVVSASVELDAGQIDDFITELVGDDHLDSALARFGFHLPSGETEGNRSAIQKITDEYPLQHLFSTVLLGPANSILKAMETPTEKQELALIEREVQRIQLFGSIAHEVLQRLEERYGFDERELGDLFSTDLIDPPVAQRIAHAFALFAAGDTDSSASVITPRLERVIRTLVQRSGATITRSPNARGTPGGVRTLGDLLSQLEGKLDESWRRYLRALLSEVTGLNLRNRIGHGLVDGVVQWEAALLLHAACFLRLVRLDQADADEAEG